MICPHCHKEIEPVEEFTSSISVVKDKDGNVLTWIEETRDVDGILIKKRVDDYGYLDGHVIDTIRKQVYGGDGMTLLSEKTIQHFEDGSPPMVTEDGNLTDRGEK